MTQAQICPAAVTAKRAISRLAYLLFTFGVGLMLCGAITGAATFASGSEPSPLSISLVVGSVCLGGIGLVAGIITLARLRQPIQVEVDPYRLIWREGNRYATLEYEEVERVEMVKGAKKIQGGYILEYPIVRFIENDGEMIEFEASFEDRGMAHHTRFDTLSITRAVLPYLRKNVVIAHAVEEFVQSGMVDIDSLPER